MKTKIYLLFALLFIGLLGLGFTQKQKVESFLIEWIKNRQAGLPLEKVYVQTDKTFYLPGEDIWFSVYLVSDGSNTPSPISDVVYVDLVNPRGNVVTQRILAAADGNAEGDFHLDSLDAGGIYTLKAYTHYMKNFGEEVFFEKKITVQRVITPRVLMKMEFEKEAYGSGDHVVADFSIRDLRDEPLKKVSLSYVLHIGGKTILGGNMHTDDHGKAKIAFDLPGNLETNDGLLNISLTHEGFTESISRSVPIVLNQIDLQFFPEGGTFVAGLPNRIAFKALNEFGKPADVSGVILDDQGREVADFESFHDGMGAFTFQPAAGRKYRAKVGRPGGILEDFALPPVHSEGMVLQVEEVRHEEVITRLFMRKRGKVHIVAHQSDIAFFEKDVWINPGENKLVIPTAGAYAGTGLITVFDEDGLPQNERLVFLNAHKKLNIQVETDQKDYLPGEEVELKLKTTDEMDQPVPARISLAVVNDRIISFADDKQDHLLSSLLLSSDLKGKIHEPAFYFDDSETRSAQALDYVMMTHGWRKFNWQEKEKPSGELAFQAETIDEISGTVLNRRKNQPIRAEIYVVEVSPEKRIAKTVTDKSGKFVVKGLDPAYDVAILAAAPFRHRSDITIRIDDDFLKSRKTLFPDSILYKDDTSPVPTVVKAGVRETDDKAIADLGIPVGDEFNLSLNEEVASLDEVVVVGYALMRKRDVSSAISVVGQEEINDLPDAGIGNVLQGRVTGISIVENSGIPGRAPEFLVRGTGSISNNQPLIVVDGIPMVNGEAHRLLNSPDIQSIDVLKGPATSVLYGSRGANGVILITTNETQRWTFNPNLGKKSFAQHVVSAQRFYRARTFYQPKFSDLNVKERRELNATVFWAPDIRTDTVGEAVIRFRNSTEVSNFRITVEGISTAGKLGREEHTLHTILPLSVDTKIPPFVCFGDTIWVPVMVKNNTPRPLTGKIRTRLPAVFEILNDLPEEVTVEANAAHIEWIKLLVKDQTGKFTLETEFEGPGFADRKVANVEVLPMGFPVYASLSGYDHSKYFEFDIHDPIPGSLKADFTGYTNQLNELLDGIESIFGMPHGCFEQTSSYTYPNILALNLIRESGQNYPEIEIMALDYIKKGYNRLIGFETREGGFEWFGRTPPHEGLTAYGLMEFHDMQMVFDGVSQKLIDRTTKWLLSRRDGNGSFNLSEKAFVRFGRSYQDVSDAYITYAFTEIGQGELVLPEFEKAYREAVTSNDSYQMALMANAALNLSETDKGHRLIDALLQNIAPDGDNDLTANYSMVRSYGSSLQLEIRALLLMALLKQEPVKNADIHKLVQYLSSKRKYGRFGSTQSTVLSLKALCLYARKFKIPEGEGVIELLVNQKNIATEKFRHNSREALTIDHLENYLAAGTQSVGIKISGMEKPIPYAMDISWMSPTPDSSPECKLAIRTKTSTRRVKLGETVRMEIELKNLTSEGLPMSMAIVGIPAGMSLQPWQLKELQEKEVFDFYEVHNNYMVLYYREIPPDIVRSVNLDLKSELPGTYQAPASSAYLYYTEEDKHWVDGEKISITF